MLIRVFLQGPHLTVNNAAIENSKRMFVLLKVVFLSVVADNEAIVTTYGLLDIAAISSMITSQLAEKLKLQGTREKVSINTVAQNNHDCELLKVAFMVRPADQDGPCFPVRHALAVESLNVSDQYCPDKLDLSKGPHLKDLEFPNVPVDLSEVSFGWCVPFGWCVAGPTNRKEDNNNLIALSVLEFDWAVDESSMQLHQQVETFWACESYGFRNECNRANRALEILKGTTRLKNGIYEIGLLWQDDDRRLPNNLPLAEKRLKQLKKRFDRSPDFGEHY